MEIVAWIIQVETGEAERDVMREAEVGVMRGGKPRNASSLYEPEKARRCILPWTHQKECSPANTLILAPLRFTLDF